MNARHLLRAAAAAAVSALALLVSPAGLPTSSAAPCPDVEVIFARGTFAPPGLGGIGQDFVDAVRTKVGDKSLGVYPVVYPASTNFPTAVDGIRDAANHIESMAANCPKTKLVLGGYSQGAAVMGFVTANAVPGGVDPADVPKPMPTQVANHVAAVALLGTPDPQFMQLIGQPPVTVGPLYASKAIQLCAPGDPICSDGDNGSAHSSYTNIGLTDQAAAFVASKV
ncbi:cutinase [Mycobacterium antarcticum]|uniref:cutinase family protein n=1 Tax=unclassified Mycolicibacterium TaxID=2636767 RepID=UPI0023880AC8|nr:MULTISPECIES: cutinase family protein [unclassified Mycolicibacterium]BDX30440.1 cutinase [Mycolicibacterium sp. TUM20985]GLP73880.1 cutinase [Mycolicibacterium sp. TUM20983]GLP79564.1 cutinase [Mycolicibacterium sp. TUM20984]